MHNLANISCSLCPSFIFFQDFLVWKLCSYCVIQSGFWISSWVQGSFHQKSLSACYSIFIMILIVLNHHKILWISRHSLPLFLTITNHWNNQNGGNSFQSNSKFSNSIINGKVKLHQWFLVFMSSFVNGSKIMLEYVNCYVMNHQRFNFFVFLLVVTELNII